MPQSSHANFGNFIVFKIQLGEIFMQKLQLLLSAALISGGFSMQTIKYKFADGTTSTVEVSDELHAVHLEIVQQEKRNHWRETRRLRTQAKVQSRSRGSINTNRRKKRGAKRPSR